VLPHFSSSSSRSTIVLRLLPLYSIAKHCNPLHWGYSDVVQVATGANPRSCNPLAWSHRSHSSLSIQTASFVQTSPLVWNSISTAQPRASGAPIVIGVARSALLDPIYARSILLVASLLDLLHSSLLPLLDLLYSSLHRYYFFERQCWFFSS